MSMGSDQRFEGKTIIVTGGTSGIGLAIARVFASEGAAVAIVGRDQERGESALREVRAMTNRAIFIRADVAQVSDTQKMVRTFNQEIGPVDILCNNAATKKLSRVAEMPVPVWDEVMASNLRGPFLCCQAVLQQMAERRRGVIINVGSIAGVAGYAGGAAYCSSKSALIMLTKVLALECAEFGIRVNCIVCGAFPTPMFFQTVSDSDQVKAEIPVGRLGQVEEVGKVASFLASEDASFMTGSVLVIDGGRTAGR